MAYRGYRSWRSRQWRTQAPSKYSKLLELFGDGVGEIKTAFLNLEEDALDGLFTDYGVIYGDAAERYARKTIHSWRSGKVKLSGQTMERLVELVPPYLHPSNRIGILKTVLSKNRKSGTFAFIDIDVKNPIDGFSKLDLELSKINFEDQLAYLPERVMQAATWLYDNDVTAARAMLAQTTKIENEMVKKNAAKEVDLLKRTILSGQVKSASYSLELPAGRIQVRATSPTIIDSIFNFFK